MVKNDIITYVNRGMHMKKLRKNWIKIVLAMFIIAYSIFETDTINELKASVNEFSKNISETEKTAKESITEDVLKVYFINVGQADAILLQSGEHNMLIDAGNNEDGVKLVNYLKEINVSKFDYVFATHAHEDHIGGMDDIINNFDIDKFFMPDVITTTKTFEDMLDALEANNLGYDVTVKGEEFDFSGATVKIIYVGNEGDDLNDTSIVIKVTHGNNSFLFTGDATSKVERKLLKEDIKSDVLKVAHHGSEYSSSDEFLDGVNPDYAIISVGKDNSYGHPKQSIIDKLNKRNVKLYRTDLSGTIIVSSNGNDISFKTVITDTNG